jgi:hypothetical protein
LQSVTTTDTANAGLAGTSGGATISAEDAITGNSQKSAAAAEHKIAPRFKPRPARD